MQALNDASNNDFSARFSGIQSAWEAVQHTGYGEAVSILANEIYGIDDFSGTSLERAQAQLLEWRQPGSRLHLLRDKARLDHVQTDDFCWPCPPDPSGRDFFLYDLSWQVSAAVRSTLPPCTRKPTLRSPTSPRCAKLCRLSLPGMGDALSR